MLNEPLLPRLTSASGGLPSAVRWAQLLMADRLRPGDIALDATAGNGHDTLFLAQTVGPEGHVYAMDLQAAAITETHRRLLEAGIPESQFTLIHAGHQTMLQAVAPLHHQRLRGIMFNLGYLPGADKNLTTKTVTTLQAVSAALHLLAPNSLLTIAVYPGHEAGAEEQRAITAWTAELSPRQYEVQLLRPINHNAAPPECWVIWKRTA